MKRNILKILTAVSVCSALLFLSSCERSVHVSAEPDPVLQVDAVIYNGKPLPVIEIKQSFTVSGREEFFLEEEDLYVNGADVTLTHNGDPVTVREVSPGMYQPESDQVVEMGDQVHISVSYEGKTVSAEAEVPYYPEAEDIAVTSSGSADISHIVLGYWLYVMPVQTELPFTSDFTALRIIAGDKEQNCWPYCNYSRYFGEQNTGGQALSLRQEIAVMIPMFEDEQDPPTGKVTVPLYIDMQIPEPIYVDYIQSYSDEFVTNTVTNVHGGVGLFIGAIHIEKEIEMDVELRNRLW